MHSLQVQRVWVIWGEGQRVVSSLPNPVRDKDISDDMVSVQLRGQRNIAFSLYS